MCSSYPLYLGVGCVCLWVLCSWCDSRLHTFLVSVKQTRLTPRFRTEAESVTASSASSAATSSFHRTSTVPRPVDPRQPLLNAWMMGARHVETTAVSYTLRKSYATHSCANRTNHNFRRLLIELVSMISRTHSSEVGPPSGMLISVQSSIFVSLLTGCATLDFLEGNHSTVYRYVL